MLITFHGKFADDYGKSHRIEAGSVAEAVSALTTQLNFYCDRMVMDRPVACIVGHDTIESLEECPDEIHIIPAVYGGGGFGKVLLGAALIGLSFITAGAATPFIAGTLTSALFGMGVALSLAGLAQMFIKAPSLSRESDPEASKYLGLSNQTTKLGTLRSYSMGRIKMTSPHLLALNVDAQDLVRGEFPA